MLAMIQFQLFIMSLPNAVYPDIFDKRRALALAYLEHGVAIVIARNDRQDCLPKCRKGDYKATVRANTLRFSRIHVFGSCEN